MNNIIFVILGSGLGGGTRYWISTTVENMLGKAFPYGTLTVNVIGSFCIGILATVLLAKTNNAGALRYLLIVGFMGGFTTFSAFSLETLHLFKHEAMLYAILNIMLSVVLCIAAVWIGSLLGKQL